MLGSHSVFIEILWCQDNYLRNQSSTYLRRQRLRPWNMSLQAQIRALPLPSSSRNLISVSDCTFCNLNLSQNPSIFRTHIQLTEFPPQLSPTQLCLFLWRIVVLLFPISWEYPKGRPHRNKHSFFGHCAIFFVNNARKQHFVLAKNRKCRLKGVQGGGG